MKKKFGYYVAVWFIAVALFHFLAFFIPAAKNTGTGFSSSFWIGYIFIMLAFIGQLFCGWYAFKTNNLKKQFLNLPLVVISYGCLLIMLAAGTLCMVVSFIPGWIGAVLCVTAFAFCTVAVVNTSAAITIVSGIDDKVQAQTRFIRSLTMDSESVAARAKTQQSKDAARRVYETVRYSDPMSNDALFDIESQITLRFHDFINAVENDDSNTASIANELIVLLEDRNRRCKLLK